MNSEKLNRAMESAGIFTSSTNASDYPALAMPGRPPHVRLRPRSFHGTKVVEKMYPDDYRKALASPWMRSRPTQSAT